jgi:hypothetical protein
LVVTTRTDFEFAVSALWNVVSQFSVPAVPKSSLKEGESQPASIGKLEFWLTANLDEVSADAAKLAIKKIRDVGTLRLGFAHSSASVRAKAISAQNRIGLPDFISDWSAAWQIVQTHSAVAFDEVRRAVQHGRTSG